jgi:hypothetical protein
MGRTLLLSTIQATVAALCICSAGHAQIVKATVADSDRVAANVYARLFAGIALGEPQRKRAMTAIKQEFVEQVSLRGEYADVMPKVKILLARRDSALRTLSLSEKDKKKLEGRIGSASTARVVAPKRLGRPTP